LQPFPPEKLQALLDELERRRPKGRAIAAFDADGTLWNNDLGESFFNYQIENQLVPLPSDPWGQYQNYKKTLSHSAAYLWLAQVCAGVELKRVREWSEACLASRPLQIFEEQRRVIDKLKQLEVEIYIVTASITWAVEPGARRLGLREDQVIGIETEVVDGVVTAKGKGVITYREGKAQALLARTGGTPPYFAAGNTEGDLWLLEAATELGLVISSAPEAEENYPTEMKMLELAQARGWYSHRY
jgi:HAD superfamily phosphoserine phosphatase-like hydrolase